MTSGRPIGVLLLVLLLGVSAAAAEQPAAVPAGADAAHLEPAAVTSLTAALARIAAAANFAFSAEITSDAPLGSGEKIQFTGKLDVAVRRPDGLRVVFDGEPRTTRSWYDGRRFTHFDPGGNAYATCEAPPNLEGLFPLMREQLGFTPPLSMLLHENVVQEALAGVASGYTVGTALVGGVPTSHLAFRGETTDLQVWIAEEGAPVIKRMVVTLRDAPAAPQFSVTFTSWDFDASFSAADFAFSAPPGAVECDFLDPDSPAGR